MNEYKQKYELYRKEKFLKYKKSPETSQEDSIKIVSFLLTEIKKNDLCI